MNALLIASITVAYLCVGCAVSMQVCKRIQVTNAGAVLAVLLWWMFIVGALVEWAMEQFGESR